jgi:hypothetical protein
VAERLHTVVLHAATAPKTPVFTGSGAIFPYGEQIYYHVINKYRYAVYIDVELVRQTL